NLTEVRVGVQKALSTTEPLTSGGIQGEKKKVESALNDVTSAVKERRKQADAILANSLMTENIDGKSESGKKMLLEVDAARAKIKKALPEHPSAKDLINAQSLLDDELKAKVNATKTAILERTNRQVQAKKILDDKLMTQAVDSEATTEEKEAIEK